MRPNTTPEYPGHLPAKRKPRWIIPTALATGGLIVGSLFTGLITTANHQARIDHCVSALDTSGEAMYAAGEAIEAAGNFDIYALETAANTLNDLNTTQFDTDITECRGTK